MIKKQIKITSLVIVLFLFLFLLAGRFLLVNQTPKNSDVIIVLGGGNGERELEASNLFKKDYAHFVILSNGGTRNNPSTKKANLELNSLIDDRIPKNAIISELSSLSTYDNAVNTKQLMEKNHFKSAIIVTSAYHLRRSKYIFDKIYEDSGITLTYKAAKAANYRPYFWWATPTGWKYTTTEYIKLVGYLFYYGLLNEK